MTAVSTPAIICAVLSHGEHGAIVRALTPDHGLLAGYVRGGRSRAMRPVLLPGNRVAADYRARTTEQLAGLTVELAHGIGPLLGEPLAAAAIDWTCALTASALPEGHAYPALHAGLDGVLNAIEAAPAARGWAVALVRYELLVLAQMGFGLDLSGCAVTGAAGPLRFVSPRTGACVTEAGAAGHEQRLLPLPAFLAEGDGVAAWDDILAGLALTRHFLHTHLLTDRRAVIFASRERLVERLKRAVA